MARKLTELFQQELQRRRAAGERGLGRTVSTAQAKRGGSSGIGRGAISHHAKTSF